MLGCHSQVLNILDVLRCDTNFEKLLGGRRLVVLLDYDGTLTPIVNNPDEACIPESTKVLLRSVAAKVTTGVVTGRSVDKIRAFVKLDDIIYAGSHGLDISGPGFRYLVAEQYLPALAEIYERLCAGVAHVAGAWVENNVFTLSVHYRNVASADVRVVCEAVAVILSEYPEMRIGSGKMVVEVRPDIAWNKGVAVSWLLHHIIGTPGYGFASMSLPSLGSGSGGMAVDARDGEVDVRPHDVTSDQVAGEGVQEQDHAVDNSDREVFTIYIGDDVTDEDAFRVLRFGADGLGCCAARRAQESGVRSSSGGQSGYVNNDNLCVQQLISMNVCCGLAILVSDNMDDNSSVRRNTTAAHGVLNGPEEVVHLLQRLLHFLSSPASSFLSPPPPLLPFLSSAGGGASSSSTTSC